MKLGFATLLIGLVSFVVGVLSVQGALKIQPQTLSGHDHGTCAVAEDGAAVCWPNHRVGDHGGAFRIDGLDDAVAVQSWGLSACAALRDGTVSCGPLRFAEEFASRLTRELEGLIDVENLDASTRGLCAQSGDGTVGCAFGSSSSSTVVPVRGVDDAVDIAVSSWAMCVLRSNGDVACQELVDGAELRSVTSGATSLIAVEVGFGNIEFMCSTFEDGEPQCWSAMRPQPAAPFALAGLEAAGSLVNSRGSICPDVLAPQCFNLGRRSIEDSRYPGPDDAVVVVRSSLHECASRPDGTVQCWGRLGGRFGDVDEPVTIPTRDFSGPVRQGWAIGTSALVLLGVSMVASTFSPNFRPVFPDER